MGASDQAKMGTGDQASQPGTKTSTGDHANQPGTKMGTSDQANQHQPGTKMGTNDQGNQPGLPLRYDVPSVNCNHAVGD
jgi:hypothetical protein